MTGTATVRLWKHSVDLKTPDHKPNSKQNKQKQKTEKIKSNATRNMSRVKSQKYFGSSNVAPYGGRAPRPKAESPQNRIHKFLLSTKKIHVGMWKCCWLAQKKNKEERKKETEKLSAFWQGERTPENSQNF